MSAVVVVFVVWFAVVLAGSALLIAYAERVHAPRWARAVSRKFTATTQAALPPGGRIPVALTVLLALWSIVIIFGWLLGLWAHRLQGVIDEPSFRWWQNHYLTGTWHTIWWKLTNIGSPRVTQGLAVLGAIVMAVLYRGRRLWWAPSAILLVGYAAEKYSQIVLKLVVHRGHDPLTRGTWPSGGMGRLLDIYGLIIFFVVLRFAPGKPRAWAWGVAVLAFFASLQAYARINNLEHWLTDVIGGFLYGLMLLATMIIGYLALTSRASSEPARDKPELEPAASA